MWVQRGRVRRISPRYHPKAGALLWLPASRVGIKGACSLALRQKESADLQPTTQTPLQCGRQASALHETEPSGKSAAKAQQVFKRRVEQSEQSGGLSAGLGPSCLHSQRGEGEPGQARRQHTQQGVPDPPVPRRKLSRRRYTGPHPTENSRDRTARATEHCWQQKAGKGPTHRS